MSGRHTGGAIPIVSIILLLLLLLELPPVVIVNERRGMGWKKGNELN